MDKRESWNDEGDRGRQARLQRRARRRRRTPISRQH